jgi:hypothetical protein
MARLHAMRMVLFTRAVNLARDSFLLRRIFFTRTGIHFA